MVCWSRSVNNGPYLCLCFCFLRLVSFSLLCGGSDGQYVLEMTPQTKKRLLLTDDWNKLIWGVLWKCCEVLELKNTWCLFLTEINRLWPLTLTKVLSLVSLVQSESGPSWLGSWTLDTQATSPQEIKKRLYLCVSTTGQHQNSLSAFLYTACGATASRTQWPLTSLFWWFYLFKWKTLQICPLAQDVV